ncbi:hypothetical protein KC946_03125 [Candidatus Saccharibacteria bacterium]|nr:hypothetical protein [Candidatus Saccharibacteria bacterium]
MSNSEYSNNWPVETSLYEHGRFIEGGLSHLEANMQLPPDGRLQFAYGLIAIGGLSSAVLAEGVPGAGKTRFGNLVAGSEVRVDIENTDTEDTLFGYPNPINKAERIDGKFDLSGENPVVYANEISHMGNTGPLHRLWDADEVEVNGQMVPMANAAIYATSNFPNSQRVHKLDDAIRSRFAIEVLFGDASSDFARTLHGRDIGTTTNQGELNTESILPNAKARADLRKGVLEAYTLNQSEFGGYVTDVIEEINGRSDLFQPISNTDKRLSDGWQQAVRAQLLVERAAPTIIGAQEAAKVASLVLPTVVTLSQSAKAELKSRLGVAKIDPLTEAITRRRLLADLAFRVEDSTRSFPVQDIQQRRDNFRDKYSFASADGQTDKIDEFIERVMNKKLDEVTSDESSTPRTRSFFRRR